MNLQHGWHRAWYVGGARNTVAALVAAVLTLSKLCLPFYVGSMDIIAPGFREPGRGFI